MIGPPTSRCEIRPVKRPRTVRTIWVEASTRGAAALHQRPRRARAARERKFNATATPIRPTSRLLPSTPLIGLRLGLDLTRAPTAAAASSTGAAVPALGLQHLEQVVPLGDRPPVDRRRSCRPRCIPARAAGRLGMTCPTTAGRNGWMAWEALRRSSSASGWIGSVTVRAVRELEAHLVCRARWRCPAAISSHEATGLPSTPRSGSRCGIVSKRFAAGRHQLVHRPGRPWSRIDLAAVLGREEREDEPREQRVHRDAGQDHDHPLPDRLRLEHPVRRHRRLDLRRPRARCGRRPPPGSPSSRSRRAAARRSSTRSRRGLKVSHGIGEPRPSEKRWT